MIIINYIYALYHQPIANISEDHSNLECNKGSRRIAFNATCCFPFVEIFRAHFDIPLAEIIGRKIFITDFGKEIAVSAERILDEAQAIDCRTQEFKGKLAGRLKFSV